MIIKFNLYYYVFYINLIFKTHKYIYIYIFYKYDNLHIKLLFLLFQIYISNKYS